MALEKTLTIDGTTYTDAYHKIVDVVLNHTPSAFIRVNTYESRSAALTGGPIRATRNYVQPVFDKGDDTQSAHSQWYTYLKTEDDFDGADDVLE